MKRRLAIIFSFIVLILCLELWFVNLYLNSQSTGRPMTRSSAIIRPTVPLNRSFSLESVFEYQDPNLNYISKPGEYTILATGDVILARSVNSQMVRKNNFLYSFEKTADFLKNADVVFINLESPLIPDCQPTDEGMVFCGNEKAVEGLVYSGVKIANIANNHMADYGLDGINNTINLLEQKKIAVTGNGKPAILDIRGKKFGFLGYNDISERYDLFPKPEINNLQNDIKNFKAKVDYIVVAFHWGIEYTSSPSARQQELAHAAIEAGADLIIGNHPHWVGAVEQYQGKLITYSHGNFIFDQMWSRETREGVIAKYVFGDNGLKNVNFYPVVIDNYSQPRFAEKEEAIKILNKIKQTSL